MARLPTVGADNGNWGSVLNEFLQVSHNTDGTLKNLYINVRDYGASGNGTTDDTEAIQRALDAATDVKAVYFPPSSVAYKITEALTILEGTKVILHPAAIIRQDTFYTAVFDLLDTPDVSIEGGSLRYEGDRTYNSSLGNFRGENRMGYGAGIWTNSNRTTVRDVKIYGFVCAIAVSGWNGSAITSYHTEDCLLENILVDTVDFGVLATGTSRFTIKSLRGKYTVSPTGSNGTPPPSHLIYFSQSNSTLHRDTVVSDCYAYDGTNSFAFQFKSLRGGSMSNLVTRNCKGGLTILDCQDVVIKGLGIYEDQESDAVGSLYMQDTASERITITDVVITKAIDSRSARLDGTDCIFSNISVKQNRSTDVTSNDVWLLGTRNIGENISVHNIGSGSARSIALIGTDCKLINPQVSGASIAVDVQSTAVRPVLEYDPGALSVKSITQNTPTVRFNGTPTNGRTRRKSLSVSYTVGDASGVRLHAPDQTHALVSVTTTSGFTIGNPYWPGKEMELTYIISNESGGSLGTITWAADHELNTSWTNPANGTRKSITFKYDGTKWREISRSS